MHSSDAPRPEPAAPQPTEQHATDRRRSAADASKRFRREQYDATRSHERGNLQSQARLERERARDDASLTEERERADRDRAREQRSSQRLVATETERRQAAETRIERLLEDLAAQEQQASELKRHALGELRAIAQATQAVLVASDARRSVEAEIRAITAATERLSHVLHAFAPSDF